MAIGDTDQYELTEEQTNQLEDAYYKYYKLKDTLGPSSKAFLFGGKANRKDKVSPRRILRRKRCCYVPNPKTNGSKSYARYEKYMVAETLDQVQFLGGKWEDIVYDYMAGFVQL